MKLTAATVRSISLPAGKSETIHFDDALGGFGLRLRGNGAKISKTWVYQYKIGDQQRRVTLGPVAALDAGRARDTAKDLAARVRLGEDPAHSKAEARAEAGTNLQSRSGDLSCPPAGAHAPAVFPSRRAPSAPPRSSAARAAAVEDRSPRRCRGHCFGCRNRRGCDRQSGQRLAVGFLFLVPREWPDSMPTQLSARPSRTPRSAAIACSMRASLPPSGTRPATILTARSSRC